VLINGEFIVKAGSTARLKWEGQRSKTSSYGLLHEDLLRTGVLKIVEMHCVFTENYAFKSPSAAASVVAGRPANGPNSWKLEDGSQTYKDWEAGKLKNAEGYAP
jgi:hypothetical protein